MQAEDRDKDRRPNPDTLLALSSRENRGRLLVFLGAAPGVGKTYAMLQRARTLKNEGVDVVVGLVETHGRAETEALLSDLEILPRKRFLMQGRIRDEFDIDGALKRKPALIIVDELAHTNAPESRHPKRWQDVEELLDARIDVWTALNIQHVESLSDVVSRITGVVVRETVPDTVLRDADDIILVDITAPELIRRLNEGKIYLPETAQRARQNFFSLRNLTALRELALRRTAARVDDQMVDQLRQSAISGPWETTERLLVCIGSDANSQEVVRVASRLATGLNAGWVAVTVEQPHSSISPLKAKRLDETLQMAKRLGGDCARLAGSNVPAEILKYAERENITQIVVGRSQVGFFSTLIGRSLSDALIRNADQIGVHVVPGEAATRKVSFQKLFPKDVMVSSWNMPWSGVLSAPITVAFTVAIGRFLNLWMRLPNLSMIFLIPVLYCAVRHGLRSAVFAAGLSFLAYDFFFVEPIYTFTIREPQEFFALLVFLGVAILTGWQTGKTHDQSLLARQNAQITQSIFELSRKLSGAVDVADILEVSTVYAQKTLNAKSIVMLLPEQNDLTLMSAWPPIDALDAGEESAARWAFDKGEAAGWRTGTLPATRFQFRPLQTTRGVVGVCGLQPALNTVPTTTEHDRTLSLILEQTAIAIDRALLVKDVAQSAALKENEKLRTVLLASLSHDLRTPLASITGAVTTLQHFGETMLAAQRKDLLITIEEESARLARFIANLLDMSRIEAGALKPKRDFVDISDIIRRSVDHAKKSFPNQTFLINSARDIPLIRSDGSLLEQVLFNLLDNAQKYGGGGNVTVHARHDAGVIIISVTDEGSGIKLGDLERVFDKFYQGGRPDGRKAGTGLGLSISRGLVEAIGGRIRAESPAARRRGTRIILELPVSEVGANSKV